MELLYHVWLWFRRNYLQIVAMLVVGLGGLLLGNHSAHQLSVVKQEQNKSVIENNTLADVSGEKSTGPVEISSRWEWIEGENKGQPSGEYDLRFPNGDNTTVTFCFPYPYFNKHDKLKYIVYTAELDCWKVKKWNFEYQAPAESKE